MTFEEYIEKMFICHPKPRLFEIPSLGLKYEKFASREGVVFQQAYTTAFYPKIITNNNTKKWLLWDNHFWDLFERFLFAIEKIEENQMDQTVAYDFFFSMFTIFLSSMFYSMPDLSLVFAKRYASTGFFIPAYHISNNVRFNLRVCGQLNNLVYCKDFVFFHELHHLQYKSNNKLRSDDFKLVTNMCKRLLNTSIEQETKEVINDILKTSNETVLEELCCDVNSVCCICHLYSGGNGYDKNISEKVIKSIRLLTFFINVFKRVEKTYKICCNTNDTMKIEEYLLDHSYKETEIRNYVLYHICYGLMGFSGSDFNTDLKFFLEDEFYYMFMRPYNDILSVDLINNIFKEKEFYSYLFKQSECATARDILIGWHDR